ncbi:MAG: AAA family ATPase, partial [Methanobacteriaceae archaeon]|nr:AAA family ATPase [Methanobacteriaceae archaeon]
MLVNKIKLNNYRNYSNIEIPLYPTLNIIIGPNGIGKTNILESVIVSSNTKSFRTLKDIELIKKEKDYSKIEIDSDVGKLKIVINKTGKCLFINDKPIKKTSEYIGRLNAILFKPSDLELFNQSPKERRKLLD